MSMWDADELDRDLMRISGGDYTPVAKWSDRFHAFANSVVSGSQNGQAPQQNGAAVASKRSARQR